MGNGGPFLICKLRIDGNESSLAAEIYYLYTYIYIYNSRYTCFTPLNSNIMSTIWYSNIIYTFSTLNIIGMAKYMSIYTISLFFCLIAFLSFSLGGIIPGSVNPACKRQYVIRKWRTKSGNKKTIECSVTKYYNRE